MSSSQALYSKQWLDDHLDLMNYAVEMGDEEWQAELLLILKDKDRWIERELKQKKKDELWRHYDRINSLLVELYSELRSSGHKEQQELMDRLLALKQQRLEISRQLATIG